MNVSLDPSIEANGCEVPSSASYVFMDGVEVYPLAILPGSKYVRVVD